MAVQKHGDVVKLDTGFETCLKSALTALCRERPQEPVKWLAHWLLEHNPNAPKVMNPKGIARTHNKADSAASAGATDLERTRAGLQGTSLVRVECKDSVFGDVGYHMPGASVFGYFPAHRVGGVGSCSMVGLGHVFHALGQGTAGKPPGVLWISLNNGPWVYINGSPHTLRAISNVKIMLDSTNGEQLQVMEEMLKADVDTEIGAEHGRLQVEEVRHHSIFDARKPLLTTHAGAYVEQDGTRRWLSVAQGSVHTPAEAVRAAAAGSKCDYASLPTPPHAPLSRATLDTLLNLLLQADGAGDAAARPAVVVCGEAGSSAATVVQVRAADRTNFSGCPPEGLDGTI
jgi:hypothetical protein